MTAVAGMALLEQRQEAAPPTVAGRPYTGRKAASSLGLRPAWHEGRAKNAYDFVSGSVIANEIEKTQINKFHTRVGHGFAAEEANALNDRLRGLEVDQVGKGNRLNGPDRIVADVAVQTKYCSSASQTVNAAFDASGVYRYDGQLLEVPHDQYADCLRLMREKIEAGKVPGVQDPNEAEMIVKRGDVTYRQALNIAKAGTIDGLLFDARSQFVTSGYAFAISFSINFAKMKWDGRATDEALADSVKLALQSGTMSFVTGIAVAQVLRTRAAAVGVVVMRNGVRALAATKVGKGLVQRIAEASLGNTVNPQTAINHVAKLLRTSVVTSVVATVVVSTPDFYRAAIKKSISWKQFGKNLAVNGAGVAGGAGGGMAGAAAGRALGSLARIPGGEKVGGVVGGIIGSLAGGAAASMATRHVLDGLIEDDAKAMIRLLPDCLEPLATDYMLSEAETREFIGAVRNRLDASFLRDMFQSASKESFVYEAFEPTCEAIVAKRPVVTLPEPSEVRMLLEKIENEAVA
ncbi:MAG: hypothetical protein Q7W30_05520 [Coriobacteriia bacterium]|nr:hypothetical protein [Coriobacteriia bacterium]